MKSLNSNARNIEVLVNLLIENTVVDESQRDEWIEKIKAMKKNKRSVFWKLIGGHRWGPVISVKDLIETLHGKK
jgi:uncharacterized pyridoxal phosphate-containing UPF0001 family protein